MNGVTRAAFDTDDDLSAVAVVADDAIDTTFAQVESALHALSPVTSGPGGGLPDAGSDDDPAASRQPQSETGARSRV